MNKASKVFKLPYSIVVRVLAFALALSLPLGQLAFAANCGPSGTNPDGNISGCAGTDNCRTGETCNEVKSPSGNIVGCQCGAAAAQTCGTSAPACNGPCPAGKGCKKTEVGGTIYCECVSLPCAECPSGACSGTCDAGKSCMQASDGKGCECRTNCRKTLGGCSGGCPMGKDCVKQNNGSCACSDGKKCSETKPDKCGTGTCTGTCSCVKPGSSCECRDMTANACAATSGCRDVEVSTSLESTMEKCAQHMKEKFVAACGGGAACGTTGGECKRSSKIISGTLSSGIFGSDITPETYEAKGTVKCCPRPNAGCD